MEPGWCFKGILVLCVYVLVLQVPEHKASAFRWTQSLQNGSTLYHCVGDDVTFRWSYVTDPGETLLALFLYSRQNGTLVTRFNNQGLTSSDRVTFVPDAGMTLWGVTSHDAGTYGIHVRLYQSSRLRTQVVNLVVVEPPKLRDNKLKVDFLGFEDSMSNNNDDDDDDDDDNHSAARRKGGRLRCGRFASVGVPPASVVWMDPLGRTQVSDVQEEGYFLFDLPAFHEGGNYTCSLLLNPELSRCLQSNQLLDTSASIFVGTKEMKMEHLREELERVEKQTSESQESNNQSMQVIKGRLLTVEDGVQNATQELIDQKTSTQQLEESVKQNLEDLKLSSHDDLVASQAEAQEAIQDISRKLSGKLDDMSKALEGQKQASSEQQDSVKVLQGQLEALQNQFRDQLKLNDLLKSELTTVRSSVDQHKAMIADLQGRLQSHKEDSERQDQVIAEQVNAQQLRTITDLYANLSTVVERLQREEELSVVLQSALRKQQDNLEAHKDTAENKQKQITASMQSSAQVQQNLTHRLEIKVMDVSEECNRKVLGVQDKMEGVRENLTSLGRITRLRLNSFNVSLSEVRNELTAGMDVLTLGQKHLNASLNVSARLLERVSALEEKLNQNVQEADQGQGQEVSSQLEELLQKVSAVQLEWEDLVPRVVSLERKMERLLPIRLVGGRSEREGRVEIRVGDHWGTVCDDDWDDEDATVVCNMLGFRSGAEATKEARFGQGSGPIFLDEVECEGNEDDLRSCTSNGLGDHDCSHREDAGVICN